MELPHFGELIAWNYHTSARRNELVPLVTFFTMFLTERPRLSGDTLANPRVPLR